MAKYGSKSRNEGPPREVLNALRASGVRPSKEKGQNFVVRPEVIDAILSFGKPLSHEHILEIGPGLGALTAGLGGGASLTLVELEPTFCTALKGKFPQATVVQGDVRTIDVSAFEQAEAGQSFAVFGNLPYVFSTEIIFHLIAMIPSVNRAVLLLQKEFAQRVASGPGSRAYGVLSVMAQLWSEVSLGPIVGGECFHPPTKVDSQVLELRFLTKPRVEVGDIFWFRRVVQAAFHARRKKLHNSLKAASIVPAGVVDKALETSGIDGSRRAETLTIDEFVSLASALKAATPVPV